MKRFKEMDKYEQKIAYELQKLYPSFYTEEKSIQVLEDYYSVLERIGWLWDPDEWAKRLHKQIQRGKSPEQWMHDVIQIDKMPNLPKTFRQ